MTIKQHTIDTPYMVGPAHFYTTEVDDQVILFDTGPPTERNRRYFQENIDLNRLTYIFITHCHIDHYGLVHWLEENSKAVVFLSYRDGIKLTSHEDRLQEMYGLLQGLGFSDGYLSDLHNTLSNGKVFPPSPMRFRLVEDEMPEHLGFKYLSCPGHSQSDLVYTTENWAITGDILLRGVFQSPLLDIDLETGQRFNNYEAYCTTLVRLATLRGKRICPGHRNSVTSVDTALLFYTGKMLDRAIQVKPYIDEADITKILSEMFGELLTEPFHIYLKTSEILFLQDFLQEPQLLKASLESIELFDAVEEKYARAVLQ